MFWLGVQLFQISSPPVSLIPTNVPTDYPISAKIIL